MDHIPGGKDRLEGIYEETGVAIGHGEVRHPKQQGGRYVAARRWGEGDWNPVVRMVLIHVAHDVCGRGSTLTDEVEVLLVHFQHPVHPLEVEDYTAAERRAEGADAEVRSPRDDRDPLEVGQAHYGLDLLRGPWHHNIVCLPWGLEGQEILRVGVEDILADARVSRADDGHQLLVDPGIRLILTVNFHHNNTYTLFGICNGIKELSFGL